MLLRYVRINQNQQQKNLLLRNQIESWLSLFPQSGNRIGYAFVGDRESTLKHPLLYLQKMISWLLIKLIVSNVVPGFSPEKEERSYCFPPIYSTFPLKLSPLEST